jgi:hypothetical protein
MPKEKSLPTDPIEKALLDFEALYTAYVEKGVDSSTIVNVPLPSGNFLHNPAKRTVKSASRWASQQINNAKSGAGDWLDGIHNPSRDPIKAAIDSEKKWENNTMQAIKDKKFVKGLQGKSLQDITSVVDKLGPSVFSAGIEAREQKITNTVNSLQPKVQAVSDAIQGMPDDTPEARKNRLLAARELMLKLGTK